MGGAITFGGGTVVDTVELLILGLLINVEEAAIFDATFDDLLSFFVSNAAASVVDFFDSAIFAAEEAFFPATCALDRFSVF